MKIMPPENFIMKTVITDINDIYKNEPIDIDECLEEEIRELWSVGIRTTGSCCGHGETSGMIAVEKTDIPQMLKLGYKPLHNKINIFFPKSKCNCENKQRWCRTRTGYILKAEDNAEPIDVILTASEEEKLILVGDIVEIVGCLGDKRVIVVKDVTTLEEIIYMLKLMNYKLQAILTKENYEREKRKLS